ncbi:hypothetical protein [Acuticoccus sediminis]|uniref:hypothetical protein n=1 Tax=Acuticoccus sediminis TaxID=2184697 RepID=UPI001CFC65A4|nr:hypothetical protein [Acuticoccus sediminis]
MAEATTENEIILNVARALWRAELGPDHGMDSSELNAMFQEHRNEYLTKAGRLIRHLSNLGFSIQDN